MKKFTETRVFKFIIVVIVLTGNIAFYTWGYPNSGAKAAWEVHPLFWGMWQAIFAGFIGSYTYFGITNT